MNLLKKGRLAIAVITARFVALARVVARSKGIEDAPLLVLPADFEQSHPDVMRRSVEEAMEQLAAIFEARRADLTGPDVR